AVALGTVAVERAVLDVDRVAAAVRLDGAALAAEGDVVREGTAADGDGSAALLMDGAARAGQGGVEGEGAAAHRHRGGVVDGAAAVALAVVEAELAVEELEIVVAEIRDAAAVTAGGVPQDGAAGDGDDTSAAVDVEPAALAAGRVAKELAVGQRDVARLVVDAA